VLDHNAFMCIHDSVMYKFFQSISGTSVYLGTELINFSLQEVCAVYYYMLGSHSCAVQQCPMCYRLRKGRQWGSNLHASYSNTVEQGRRHDLQSGGGGLCDKCTRKIFTLLCPEP
jgi:hypothetical protein